MSGSSPQHFKLLEYDADYRLTKISSAQVGNPPVLATAFFYDSQNRLIETRDYGNANGPHVLHEIRKFYYDAAGNCIGDTAFDENMYKTHYWDNSYTFDGQGRMLSKKHANDNVFRYEYGAGKNPVKAYMHFSGKPELERIIYNKFDDKKTWLGESPALRLYFRVYGHKYAEDFFENNAIDYKETVSTINGTSIYERADMKKALQYNASGYPVKREVIQTSTGGTSTVYKEQYEYEEK